MKKNILFLLLSVLMLNNFAAYSQFDGWQNFTQTTPITSWADYGQEIIIGTSGGIVRINKNTSLKTVMTKANTKLFSIDITSMLVDKNEQLWLGTTQGFSREGVDTAIFQASVDSKGYLYTYGDEINSLSFMKNSNFAIGFRMGLAIYDGKKTRIFRYSRSDNWIESLDSNNFNWTGGCDVMDVPQNWITCVASDSSNFIWAGSHKGLFKTDFSTWTSYDTANSKLPNNNITCLALIDSNEAWVGTSKGLAHFKSNAWQTINAPNYNVSDSICCLFVDSYKNLWMVNSLGIIHESGGNWTLADGSAIANKISRIMEDSQGIIWAATDTAIYNYTNNQLQFYASLNNLGIQSNTYYTNFVEDSKGNVWCGIYGGIMNFNGSTWSGNLLGSKPTGVRNLCIDDKKSVWAATYKGIIHFGENSPTFFSKENSYLPSNNVNAIICDKKGTLWAGIDSGLFSYNGTQWDGHLSRLSSTPIQGLFVDNKNNIWAWSATGTGDLEHFDGIQWKKDSLNYMSPFATRQIAKVMSDSSGNIWAWIDSYDQIICGPEFSGTFLAKFDGQQWTNFNTVDMHLPCNRIYSLTVDTNGIVWAGSCGGSAAFINNSWKFYDEKSFSLPFHKPTLDFIDSKHNYWIAQNGDGIFFKPNPTGIFVHKNSAALCQDKSALSIFQNRATRSTIITYRLMSPGRASIGIFNLQGKLVWSMTKYHSLPGFYSCIWTNKTISGYKMQPGVFAIRFLDEQSAFCQKISFAE